MKPELNILRERCPLPVLMKRLGLEHYAKPSCTSPFRNDEHASWGIYTRNGRYWYKDFATGEAGDEISLLAQVYQLDQQRDFKKLLLKYQEIASEASNQPPAFQPHKEPVMNLKPDTSFLRPGTNEEICKLANLRAISVAGLMFAQDRGALRFGNWLGYDVFAVVDATGCLAELRRLDGQLFEACGSLAPRKSHTLKHSRKNWPLGITQAADCAGIALVEGLPDYLALHQFMVEEQMVGKVAPVAMLTGSALISAEAISHFQDKLVRIFPHHDAPGYNAASRWQIQLHNAGAACVDYFNFGCIEIAGQTIKDLCDFNQHRNTAGFNQPIFTNLA